MKIIDKGLKVVEGLIFNIPFTIVIILNDHHYERNNLTYYYSICTSIFSIILNITLFFIEFEYSEKESMAYVYQKCYSY